MKITSTLTLILLYVSTILAFIGSYFMELTASNIEQYFAVILVVLADGFFGIIGGIKREGFKTYKSLKILKTLSFWVIILSLILSIEKGFKGTSWLSETLIVPFLVFQFTSVIKNASMAGFITNSLMNSLLDQIDRHKGERKK
jgi:hypothetical protein